MDWLCWEKNIHPNIEASPKWLDWASFVFANKKIGCVSSKTVKNLMYNKMKDWKWCLWLPAYARDHGNHPFAEGLVWVRSLIFTLLCHLLQCWEGYGAVWKHRFWSLSLSLSMVILSSYFPSSSLLSDSTTDRSESCQGPPANSDIDFELRKIWKALNPKTHPVMSLLAHWVDHSWLHGSNLLQT